MTMEMLASVMIGLFPIAMLMGLIVLACKKRRKDQSVFLFYAFGVELIMWILSATELMLVVLCNMASDRLIPLDYIMLDSIASLAYWFYLLPCYFILPALPCLVGFLVFLRERKKPHLADQVSKKARYLLLVLAISALRLVLLCAVDAIFLIHFNAQIPG